MALLNTDEPHGNGTSGMPWQVRAIGLFGIPGAIALWFVWTVTGAQAQDIAGAKAQLASHAHAAALHAVESDNTGRRLERLLSQICVNVADTTEERAGCFR